MFRVQDVGIRMQVAPGAEDAKLVNPCKVFERGARSEQIAWRSKTLDLRGPAR